MFFWNSLAFFMIQRMLAIWSLVPLPFLNPAWTPGNSWFTLLKPSMQDFKHDLTSVGDECSCPMVSIFFSIALLGNWYGDWCWSWNSSILVTWCEQLTHWKSPWGWERLRAEEKGASENEMAGQHYRCNDHELGQTPGDCEGQGGLVCCSPWGCKELDTTGHLNDNNILTPLPESLSWVKRMLLLADSLVCSWVHSPLRSRTLPVQATMAQKELWQRYGLSFPPLFYITWKTGAKERWSVKWVGPRVGYKPKTPSISCGIKCAMEL